VPIAADTRVALPMLVEACAHALERDSGSKRRIDDRRRAVETMQVAARERRENQLRRDWDARPISMNRLNAELFSAVQGKLWMTTSARGGWEYDDPGQIAGHAGSGGGSAGLGLSMGVAMGEALAHRGSSKFLVNVSGDGEFLFTPSSLWTAANMKVPLLTVVNNNRLYGNDEGHQEYVARVRERPVENKFVGIALAEPPADLGMLARSFGVEGFGPIEDPDQLSVALEQAVEIVANEHRPVLVDVITANERGG
jgi:acetolactate synthase I/II/III large subunit